LRRSVKTAFVIDRQDIETTGAIAWNAECTYVGVIEGPAGKDKKSRQSSGKS
jgi:hypothetical protein